MRARVFSEVGEAAGRYWVYEVRLRGDDLALVSGVRNTWHEAMSAAWAQLTVRGAA